MLNIQRRQSKREGDDDEDSEDDLNGWDFRQKNRKIEKYL